jgi:hypothetical protein
MCVLPTVEGHGGGLTIALISRKVRRQAARPFEERRRRRLVSGVQGRGADAQSCPGVVSRGSGHRCWGTHRKGCSVRRACLARQGDASKSENLCQSAPTWSSAGASAARAVSASRQRITQLRAGLLGSSHSRQHHSSRVLQRGAVATPFGCESLFVQVTGVVQVTVIDICACCFANTH